MTLDELKIQIKLYLVASIESGLFTKDHGYNFRPELQQRAYQLGLSDADLQQLINIVGSELNLNEICERARHRQSLGECLLPSVSENIAMATDSTIAPPSLIADNQEKSPTIAAELEQQEQVKPELSQEKGALNIPPSFEGLRSDEEMQKRTQEEEEQYYLTEFLFQQKAIARKKAELEAIERHNRLIHQKQEAENSTAAQQPPLENATFEGKNKNTETVKTNSSLIKQIVPFIIAFLVLGIGGIAAFFWYKNNYLQDDAFSKKTEMTATYSLTGSNLAETDVEGVYVGFVGNRNNAEPIQIKIFDVRKAVNQRFVFQFRGNQRQVRRNIQGFGQVELSKGTIYMGHRLMGDAVISKADNGTVSIRGANFQLSKKP
jgi:hypothetical protein